MLEKLRNPAAILIAVALLIAAGAGFATGAKLITSKDVKNNSLTGEDIKDKSVTSKEVKNNNLTGSDLKDNSVVSADIKNGAVATGDVKDSTIATGDIKNGTVGSGDLANGSVTKAKIAPGAIAFPNSLWGPSIRNQTGAAQSGGQTGPTGQPLGDGSLGLSVEGTADLAAFGNSFDFAGVELEDITGISYATYVADASPVARPSLRIEINPHLVDDDTLGGVFEFTTLTYEPLAGATGWETHADALADEAWYLSGDEGLEVGCTQAAQCSFTDLLSALDAHADLDTAPPAVSTGVYFGLGSGITVPTETAVDAFVFNGFEFDFEATGVFLRTL